MEAQLAEFRNSLESLTREELIDFTVELKRQSLEDNIRLDSYESAAKVIAEDYAAIRAERDSANYQLKELQKKYDALCENHVLSTKYRFGCSSEKLDELISSSSEYVDPLSEDNDNEEESSCSERKVSSETKCEKKPRSKKRGRDLSKLAHVRAFELDVEALNNEHGEGNWRIYNWSKKETVGHIRSTYYVTETYSPIISVGLEHDLYRIPKDNVLYPGSLASPSLVASIIYDKYVMGLPLCRQEYNMNSVGFPLSRQTMSNWMMYFSEVVFLPVYEYMHNVLMSYPHHQCDETVLEVIKDGRSHGTKSYMWVHISSELCDCNPIVQFCFELTRSADHLIEFYKGFTGSATCDAFSAYFTLEKTYGESINICGCFMHCRRRFADALSIIDTKKLSEEAINELPEVKCLQLIGDIYKEDEKLKPLSADERKEQRASVVLPLVDKFFSHIREFNLDDPKYSEKFKDAVSYSLNQEKYLRKFLDDGNIPIDNGETERKIRRFAIGRRGWLFSNTVRGAEASAILYSIVGTAAANGADEYFYLKYLLEEVPKHLDQSGTDFLADMMPWSNTYKSYEVASKHDILHSPLASDAESPPKIRHKNKKAIVA